MAEPATSIQNYFATLDQRFVASAAKGVKATYQIELSGPNGGTWVVDVNDGAYTLHTAPVEKPTVTYQMDAGDYLNMANGDLDGTKAYMLRKLKVKGNLLMAQKFKGIIPPAK
jgi:putative sterol carrier protein